MASETEVCNVALARLGSQRITSLSDGSPNANYCNDLYDTERKALLRRYEWAFARKRASLPTVTGTPAWGFENAFQLPSDCLQLRAVRVTGSASQAGFGRRGIPYQVEGRTVVTNIGAPLDILYTVDVENVNDFDPLFFSLLAQQMAYQLARPVADDSAAMKRELLLEMESIYVAAIAASAIERSEPVTEDGDWISVRRVAGGGDPTLVYG